MPTDPAETVALFRYRVIAEAANPRLGPAERGQLVRELASQPVELPDGSLHHFSRGTFDRWLRAYREQGLAASAGEARRPRSGAPAPRALRGGGSAAA